SWADLRGKSREPERVSPLSPLPQIPEKQWHFMPRYSVKLGIGIILASLGIISWQKFAPTLATRLNNSGMDSYGIGDLSDYWKKLDLAGVFDPYNPTVYYNKAWPCETVRDYDCARVNYQKAARLGSAPAYNQLGSISMKVDKDYHTALHFFTQGLQLATLERDKFALYKNLGWTQLKLGREVEAGDSLEMALNLNQNYASPYCLLAQVRENLGQFPEAIAFWEECQILANPQKPEEYLWLGMAKQRLSEIKLPQN
ncbi:MAG: tetratricopeptide repeat protein, partial [Chroococcales cyanobacterium]